MNVGIKVVGTLALALCAEAQPSIKVTSPVEGAIVNPGHTLTIGVDVSGAAFDEVAAIAPWDPSISKSLMSPPYQFTFTIPSTTTPGVVAIAAMGHTSAGMVFAVPVAIDVERPDSPVSVTSLFSDLEEDVGSGSQLHVQGKYSDGSTVNLTKSTQTTYTSKSPAIATVTANGTVMAIAPGTTQIAITHQASKAGVKKTMSVTVVVH